MLTDAPATAVATRERPIETVTPERTPTFGHQPALDGLRGIAVGTVLLFHAGISWAAGGFAGIDVFFVLSGFLITTLLLAEVRRSGTVSLGSFWSRRARRLLPVLYVVLLVVDHTCVSAKSMMQSVSQGAEGVVTPGSPVMRTS